MDAETCAAGATSPTVSLAPAAIDVQNTPAERITLAHETVPQPTSIIELPMDRYHIALFIHIVTLVVAASVTSIVKLAATRRIHARTIGEALEWHNMMSSAAKLFPACLVSFTATGFYMLNVTGGQRLAAGYVDAGLVGVILLLSSGTYLGVKASGVKRMLEAAATRDAESAPPRMVPPLGVRVLPVVNTGIALGVVFDMVTKPTSIPVALGVVALGGVVGFIMAARQAPVRAAASGSAGDQALMTP